jgi:hypothetical protein
VQGIKKADFYADSTFVEMAKYSEKSCKQKTEKSAKSEKAQNLHSFFPEHFF